VDVTPRYTQSWKSIAVQRFEGKQARHAAAALWRLPRPSPVDRVSLWSRRRPKDLLRDPRPVQVFSHHETPTQFILRQCCRGLDESAHRRLLAEHRQLDALLYGEPLPNTLSELKSHQLYVLEDQIGRYEGVYPQDATTLVGYIRQRAVYKRSAVHLLRARQGWLRLGRMVTSREVPHKIVLPPASQPASTASELFGFWQTDKFAPLPIQEDGTIPRDGHTNLYMLLQPRRFRDEVGQTAAGAPLQCPPGEGLVHLRLPHVASVARRMNAEHAFAVVGYKRERLLSATNSSRESRTLRHRSGRWMPVIDGIVVPTRVELPLRLAYEEWVSVRRAHEAKQQRKRAIMWWRRLISGALSRQRIAAQYLTSAP